MSDNLFNKFMEFKLALNELGVNLPHTMVFHPDDMMTIRRLEAQRGLHNPYLSFHYVNNRGEMRPKFTMGGEVELLDGFKEDSIDG